MTEQAYIANIEAQLDGLALDVPSNIEAEAVLIGAMLSQNEIIDPVADRLTADDFMEPLHQRLFTAITALAADGKGVSPVTLKPIFENDPAIADLGGVSYLAKLTSNFMGLLNWRETTNQIHELATLRRMQLGLSDAAKACGAAGRLASCAAAIREIGEQVDAALELDRSDPIVQVTAGQALEGLLRSFNAPSNGVTSGSIPELDRVLGPVRPNDLIILAARPGMGKTAVAISYAIGAAKAGHGVLFVSLEMSSNQIAGRMAADWCFTHGDNSVPYAAINDGKLDEWQRQRVERACEPMHRAPLQIIDTGQLTLARLNGLVKRQARRFRARGEALELVVIDYLQLMRAGPKSLSKYEDVSEVSNGLKRIAKDHDVGVMALCQLSREVEKRPDKRPILADLRDSGSIEQDADSVLFLLRDEYYLETTRPAESSPKFPEWRENMDRAAGKIEFIAAKRRNGRVGTGVGTFYGIYQAVR